MIGFGQCNVGGHVKTSGAEALVSSPYFAMSLFPLPED